MSIESSLEITYSLMLRAFWTNRLLSTLRISHKTKFTLNVTYLIRNTVEGIVYDATPLFCSRGGEALVQLQIFVS